MYSPKKVPAPPEKRELNRLKDSEAIYRTLLNATPYGIFILGRGNGFLEVNREACRQLGYTKKELLRKKPFDIIGRNQAEFSKKRTNRFKADGRFKQCMHRRKDGTEFPVEMVVRKIICRGQPASFAIVKDISKEKRINAAMADSEKELHAILDNAPVYVFMTRNERITYVNKRTFEDSGAGNREELIGRKVQDLVAPPFKDLMERRFRTLFQKKKSAPQANIQLVNLKGKVIDITIQSIPIRHQSEDLVITFAIDISEIKRTECKLKESERLYKTLTESIPDYIYLLDRQGRVTYRNRYLAQFRTDPLGKLQDEIFPPESAKKHMEVINRVFSSREPSTRVEYIPYHGNNNGIYFENRIIPVKGGTAGFNSILGITRDITQQIKTEEALKNSNTELALYAKIDALLLCCHGNDMYGEIMELLSRTFSADCGIFGYIDETGELVAPRLPKNLARKCAIIKLPLHLKIRRNSPPVFGAAISAKGRIIRLKQPHKLFNGRLKISEVINVPLIFNHKAIGIIMLARRKGAFTGGDLNRLKEISRHLAPTLNARLEHRKQEVENRKMITEFINAQKIESLGVMAGGIAHDFNNMLAGVMANLSLLAIDVPKERKDWHEMITEAMEAAENSRYLAQQIITFAKGGNPTRKNLNFGVLTKKAARFAVRGSNCTPRFEINDDLWHANCDEIRITQVIHNIVLNSIQATPKGGNITITASNERISDDSTWPLRKGHYIKLSIHDNGSGITPENQKKIFLPFFSTKVGGKGLGLAMAYSIIRRHNGHITVESSPGKGARFTIYLPAATGSKSEGTIADKSLAITKGHGRVLIMDDNAMAARALSKMVGRLGYTPVAAHKGEKVLQLYFNAEKAGRPFKAVIMDLVMPGAMGGKEAVQLLKKLHPKAKVIVSSGYYDAPVLADHAAYGFDAALVKPYKIHELSKVLSGLQTLRRYALPGRTRSVT